METVAVESALEWGVATLALGGQTVSGDQHLVRLFPNGSLVAVMDGLGHGQEAALAAKTAVATLEATSEKQLSLIALMQRCHEALTQTRGVVMSLAMFNQLEHTMIWLGVGNVAGVLLRADPATNPAQENLLLRGGVVGYQLPALSAAVVPVTHGDLLIFATDGLNGDFAHGVTLNESPQRLAARILAQYGKGTDDALVLVARWDAKKKEGAEEQKAEG